MLLTLITPILLLFTHHASTTPTNLTTPPPSTPSFSLGPKIPFPAQSPPTFPLLPMLFHTLEGLYAYARLPFASPAQPNPFILPTDPSAPPSLRITLSRSSGARAESWQTRHAMWALWVGASRQLGEKDFRPGVFVADVGGRSVGSIAYNTVQADANANVTIEQAVPPSEGGVDVSKRLLFPRQDNATASNITRFAKDFVVVEPNGTGGVGAGGESGFYNIQITEQTDKPLQLTNIFLTLFEAMIARAGMADREMLNRGWIYRCDSTGYAYGLRPGPGSLYTEPPFDAIMGAMANLPRAMRETKLFVEVGYDVVDSETGAVVLQGFIAGSADVGGEGGMGVGVGF